VTKVLAGCRVIEQGVFITGPYAGMLLADLGAEVIKVEHPKGGDPFRNFQGGLYGPQFQAYNRNKKSIALDLANSADRATFRDLIASADVYIQNFRPGVAEKLGAGAKALRKLNPRLVYCAISGFGRDGPYADRPTYDTVAQAMSGWLSMLVRPEDPLVAGPAISDAVTGLYAAYGVLGALYERNRTGKGRLVEISMHEATINFASEPFHNYFVSGAIAGPRDRSRISQSFAFTCADGGLIAVHLSSLPKFWEGFLRATEQEELANDPRFAARMSRIGNYDALKAIMQPVFAARPRREWLDRLRVEDVPHAPILNIDEVIADPQTRHLGVERHLTHKAQGKLRVLSRPVVYDGKRKEITVTPPPVLDEHGAQIRRTLNPVSRKAGKPSTKAAASGRKSAAKKSARRKSGRK
jgi:crotonobetainyl-CoA:carnitine CoA-transferase CaiB-like acyl-CoA transferase